MCYERYEDSIVTDPIKCPQCGGEVPANFPPGVCPACLLRQGMSPSTLTGAAGEASGASGSSPRRSWTPLTPAELAPKFPQLEIVELLGQGGMGAVYKVRQRDLDRWAALKILPGDVANDPNFSERFQREARALAQLGHQHIVIVYEFGQREGVYFLLMEYIDGVTLRQASRAGQVTEKDALGIVTQICDALQFAHEEGVVHRDIKPENILIDKRGRVKIADFGLAKLLGKQPSFPTLTGTHQIMGTPAYMAPEQMEGSRSIDHRADIFSLGVVFYELLTGELPLGRFAPPSQKYSLDVRLDEIVLRTLEKEPDRRYQQASDVKCDVETIRSQPAVASKNKVEKPRSNSSFARMAALAVAIMLGTFAGLVGCVLFISWLGRSLASQHEVAATPQEPVRTHVVVTLSTAAQKEAAIQRYVAEVERQRLDQQRLEEATRDPNEVNALVQFTADGVKLHPHGFGTDEMTPDQRVTVEKILTAIHGEYLKAEAMHSRRTDEDGGQTVTIEPFGEDLAKLENDLWTAVDTQLPITAQKALRQRLPLYADSSVRLPQVNLREAIMGGGSAPMSSMPSSFGGGGMAGPPAAGGFGSGGTTTTPSNLRYQQLLGWKTNQLSFRISIGRQGKWFRWQIAAPTLEQFAGGFRHSSSEFTTLDSGEAPELPSGLRRFWRESDPSSPTSGGTNVTPKTSTQPKDNPETAFQRAMHAYAVRDWGKYADCFTEDARNESSFEFMTVASQIYGLTELAISSGTRQKQGTMNAHAHAKQFNDSLEKAYPDLKLNSEESQARMKTFIEKLQQTRYSRPERQATTSQFIRETIGDHTRDFFMLGCELMHSLAPNRRPLLQLNQVWVEGDQAGGTHTLQNTKSSPITFKKQDGEWKISGLVDVSISDQTMASGGNPASFNYAPDPNATTQEPAGPTLAEQLLALDRLRAADQTPWEEVEKRANELLAKYTAPADKGRIHWMAAHVNGQSDMRGHGADVTRHGQEALKYERDPVQRGWLYMYLGCAAGLIEKREEATRWHLKSYLELLPFNLPDMAPELPTVGKFRGERFGPTDGEVDPDQIAAEVLQAAEMRARKEAELVRDLVNRRNVTIGLLQDLYGREYKADSDATVTLRKLATEILRDEPTVTDLLQRVWPDSIPKS